MKTNKLKTLSISFGLAVSVFSTTLSVPVMTSNVYAAPEDGDIIPNPYTKFDNSTDNPDSPSEPVVTPTTPTVKSFTIKKTGQTYKVISAESKTVKLTAVKTKKTKVTIPKTVTYKKVKYKVVTVGKSSFKNSKKVKTVVVEKNVKKIESKAFYGCKNLKLVNIKTKALKSVGKNAFKNINKKAKIK
ncbi:MAG: leucine-rich repeat protein, partial [Lachnospiraceae bacterium]|nr:leucine-rich repeat protein [Lachnospiraceae bacterium]